MKTNKGALAACLDTPPTSAAPISTSKTTARIFPGVPFDEYLRWPEISQSSLKEARVSLAHFKAQWDGEREREVTDFMLLGSALHTAFLEPELMTDRVTKWANGTRRGKEWEAFKADNAHRIILTEAMHEKLIGMVRSLRRHPEVKRWLSKIEEVEVSARGKVNGLDMKGRIDALTPDPLIDLKKVSDGDPRMFNRSVYDFGYHIQGAIYRQLFNRDRFLLMTVEDCPPYDVVPYELSQSYLDRGWREACELIERVQGCIASGNWPGRSSNIQTLDEPAWLAAQEESNGKVRIS